MIDSLLRSHCRVVTAGAAADDGTHYKATVVLLFASYVPPCRGCLGQILDLQQSFGRDARFVLLTKEG